jgi:hypothetical protein
MAMEESALKAKKFRSAKKNLPADCGNRDFYPIQIGMEGPPDGANHSTPAATRGPDTGVIDRLAQCEGQAGRAAGDIGNRDRQGGAVAEP